jgi:hypothetical protein
MATRATKINEMLGTFHKFASEQHGKCVETMEKGASREFHENMSQHHAEMADQHLAECDAANKAAADDILKVSALAPTVPPNVRAVLRPGQRDFDNAAVAPEFAKFVSRVCDEEN